MYVWRSIMYEKADFCKPDLVLGKLDWGQSIKISYSIDPKSINNRLNKV